MADVSAPSSQWWFRAAGTEKVYGPVSPEVLLGWAREGRIYPEDKVSSDNASWGDARGLPFLAMDTVIVRPDGRVLGPFHRDAVEALRKVGKVPPESVVRSARELLESADSAAAPAAGADAARAYEARLEQVRTQARDALAEKDREIEGARAEAGIAAARADAEWLRGRLSDLLADVFRRFPKPVPAAEPASPAEPEPAKPASSAEPETAEPEPATPAEPEPAGPEPEPDARASGDDVFVEAEAIDEPPPGFRRLRVHPIPDPAAARAAEEPRAGDPPRKPRTGMAALEDQLKDELRRAAGAAPSAGRATGSKIMDFFKRK